MKFSLEASSTFFLDFEQAKEYFSERYSKYKKKNDAAVEKRCVQKSNR